MRSGKEKKTSIGGKSIGCSSPEDFKRKASDQIDESSKELEATDKSVDSVDLISDLPTHIIHHILWHLRCKKDAARTSVLSKRWRDICASFSILDFDERKFQQQEKKLHGCSKRERRIMKKVRDVEILKKQEMFRNFVDTTLQTRAEQKSGVQKFMLHMTSYDVGLAEHVDRWIRFATESNIQWLDIYVPRKTGCYNMPQTVFATKSMTELRIFGCNLGACNDIKLFGLRKLCLGKLPVCSQKISNLLLSCPSIEDLRLIQCFGFKNLLLSSNKLIRVDIDDCNVLKDVALEAPCLQTFWFRKKKSKPCKFNLAMSKSLISLTLEDGGMTDDLFQDQISNFPVLEHLTLSKCNALESIMISSHRLKTLVFRECVKLKEADMDTPNLVSFEYKGHQMPFSSLNPSGLKEAKFYFDPHPVQHQRNVGFFHCNNDSVWFANLQKLLGMFDLSKGLKSVMRYKKNVIIHEDLREILVPRIHDLKLEIIKSSTCMEDLIDNLLRALHPETISIVSSTTSNFPEQVYKKMVDGEVEPLCCEYNSPNNKCWRHFLKEVNVENLSDTTETSDWITWLRSSTYKNKMRCFRLDWERK